MAKTASGWVVHSFFHTSQMCGISYTAAPCPPQAMKKVVAFAEIPGIRDKLPQMAQQLDVCQVRWLVWICGVFLAGLYSAHGLVPLHFHVPPLPPSVSLFVTLLSSRSVPCQTSWKTSVVRSPASTSWVTMTSSRFWGRARTRRSSSHTSRSSLLGSTRSSSVR